MQSLCIYEIFCHLVYGKPPISQARFQIRCGAWFQCLFSLRHGSATTATRPIFTPGTSGEREKAQVNFGLEGRQETDRYEKELRNSCELREGESEYRSGTEEGHESRKTNASIRPTWPLIVKSDGEMAFLCMSISNSLVIKLDLLP